MTSTRLEPEHETNWCPSPPEPVDSMWSSLEEVTVVTTETPLPDCLAAMATCRLNVAVVIEEPERRPVGLLDARALLSRLLQGSSDCRTAEQVMRPCQDLIARPENEFEAEALLDQKRSPYLIIVNDVGTFESVLSLSAVLSRRRQRYREYVQRLEATLDEMRADIQQMQEEHTEILGVLAHDLRGPLGGILGLARMVSADGPLPSAALIREYFRLICTETEQCLRLTGEILEFSRHRSHNVPLELTSCNPVTLLEEVTRLYEELARHKGIQFETHRPTDLAPGILADRQRLHTVLANLLDNAVKYCAAGQKITASLEYSPHRVSFVIADNGQGLPKDEIEKLFVRFYRGSSKPTAGEASSGLGLAIAREIVEAHGGTISAKGDRGQGMTFRIDLPMHSSPVMSHTKK
jgi:signal transduction histidine kinase